MIELTLLAALLLLLGVAAWKFFRMLDQTGVEWTRGLPVGVLFVGAGYLTYRRIVRGVGRLRSGGVDGHTRHDQGR